MTMLSSLLLASILWMGGDNTLRIATYNVENFDISDSAIKRDALRAVIAGLDADVIGFQEVADRAALEQIVPPRDWHIIIDDDSQPSNPRFSDQDLAVAVRKPHNFRIHGSNGNARDEDFLFSDGPSLLFPGRRDVLVVEVLLAGGGSLFVMNQHAKSRFGGRASTNFRREGAALEVVRRLERDYDEALVAYLGDLNDSPDDRSVNILETGDPQARASMENDPGPFMINLTEPLWAQGFVTYGWYREGDRLVVRDPEARLRQYHTRLDNRIPQGHEFATILDNILVSPQLERFLIAGSTAVYSDPISADASDHLPVYADFAFFAGAAVGDGGQPTVWGGLVIAALLVNPAGPDAGAETVLLRNGSARSVSLQGLTLKDRAGHQVSLVTLTDMESLAAGKSLLLTLPAQVLPLNNSGDWVGLFEGERLLHEVAYTRQQVQEGQSLIFAERVRAPRELRSSEPTDYYAAAEGKTGAALKAALHGTISDHQVYNYGDLWRILEDVDGDSRQRGHVRGFYSGRSIPAALMDSGKSRQDDHWNREHIWPKSQGFKQRSADAFTDVHHVRAADKSINAARSNKQFADGGETHGECDCQYTDETWQPPARVRGDVARMLFYMATRYEGEIGSRTPDLELVKGKGKAGVGELGDLCTLLRWHAEDPVDEDEQRRNQLVFEYQGNRNPFVDHPEFAASIWSGQCP